MPDFIMGVAEITPLVQEVSGDDVIYGMVREVKFILLKLQLFLEFLKKLLVFFILLRGYFFGGPAARSGSSIILDVH